MLSVHGLQLHTVISAQVHLWTSKTLASRRPEHVAFMTSRRHTMTGERYRYSCDSIWDTWYAREALLDEEALCEESGTPGQKS